MCVLLCSANYGLWGERARLAKNAVVGGRGRGRFQEILAANRAYRRADGALAAAVELERDDGEECGYSRQVSISMRRRALYNARILIQRFLVARFSQRPLLPFSWIPLLCSCIAVLACNRAAPGECMTDSKLFAVSPTSTSPLPYASGSLELIRQA